MDRFYNLEIKVHVMLGFSLVFSNSFYHMHAIWGFYYKHSNNFLINCIDNAHLIGSKFHQCNLSAEFRIDPKFHIVFILYPYSFYKQHQNPWSHARRVSFVKNMTNFTSLIVSRNNIKEQMHFPNSRCVCLCTKVHNEKKLITLLNFAGNQDYKDIQDTKSLQLSCSSLVSV